jgi:hypothetical protein
MRYTTVLTCVMVSAAALASEPAAAQISHQGQDVSDHVVLRDSTLSGRAEAVCPFNGSFKGRGLFRLFPDGTPAPEPFAVPAGRQLVITDVEWTVDALITGLPLTPGETVRTRLRIGGGTTFNTVFLSRTVVVGSESGRVSASEQLTTGFVVASNTAICPDSAEDGSGALKAARLIEIVLRGYLISSH